MNILPKEITKDADTGIEIASFDYYEGNRYAKEKGLQFSISFSDVFKYTHFLVCCGNIMIRVNSDMFYYSCVVFINASFSSGYKDFLKGKANIK